MDAPDAAAAAAAGVQGVVGLAQLQPLWLFRDGGGGTGTASLVRTRGSRGIVVRHRVAVVPPSPIVRFVHLSCHQQQTEVVLVHFLSQLIDVLLRCLWEIVENSSLQLSLEIQRSKMRASLYPSPSQLRCRVGSKEAG